MSGPECFCYLYKFLAELYPNGIYPYLNQYLFRLMSISSSTVWITKKYKYISEILFFLLNYSYQLANSDWRLV